MYIKYKITINMFIIYIWYEYYTYLIYYNLILPI